MSKFEVGDRVVVVGAEDLLPQYRFSRGEVTAILDTAVYEYSIEVKWDDGGTGVLFKPNELELEGVYDELSAKPSGEVISDDPKVDMRYTGDKGVEEFPLPENDVINHPSHYADGWSNGAEVIDITEHLNFNRGNAVKYLSRAGKKGGPEKELEDLQKALWYIRREVGRLGGSV